jgi:acyl-CoA dehydrogenase
VDRTLYEKKHRDFRDRVKSLYIRELLPKVESWEQAGIVDRDFWLACGANGLLLPDIPQEYGGGGHDFRHNAIILEETAFAGTTGPAFGVHNDIVAHYIHNYGSDSVKREWLPRMASGEAIGAICMTEPNTGSDLRALRTHARPVPGGFLLSGSKTFITNGINADIAVVAACTGASKDSKEISLFVVDAASPGFIKGRSIAKIGNRSSDTAELFFEEVFIPTEHLIGRYGNGFKLMMQELPQERLSIAISCQAAAQHAFDITAAHLGQHHVGSQPKRDSQHARHQLAAMKTQLQVGWAHIDACLLALIENRLTTGEAASAKLWHSELRCDVVDDCVQLFGGSGFIEDYEIARLWRDARVMRIYGGTSEIMKELVSRTI